MLYLVVGPLGQGDQGGDVEAVLAVGVGHGPGEIARGRDASVAAKVWPEEESLVVVVIGVDVVPDDGLPLDHLGQGPALLGGDHLRHHHGPCPEHVDAPVQLLPDGLQIL